MIKFKIQRTVLFITLCSIIPAFLSAKPSKKVSPWNLWLNEVDPIITSIERFYFKNLKTEEDRKNFQRSFWKARDPNPNTPINEYKIEYYSRLEYVKRRLDGPKSDRGKIYLLLGKPSEVKDFSGYTKLIDCQLWCYQRKGRPGLPPFMNLLFFKQHNMGDYQLFYPGIHGPLDLLSPDMQQNMISLREAYSLVQHNSAELAQATLSIIPGEVNPNEGITVSSSNYVLSKIYTLPEREVESSYIRNFKSVKGDVDVQYSTNAIQGYGAMSITRSRDLQFLNFAVMPHILTLREIEGKHHAKIDLILRIEAKNGKVVFQNTRTIHLKFTDAQKNEIQKKKMVFRDFIPIIEGDFKISVSFFNRESSEFFIYSSDMNIQKYHLPVIFGHKIKELDSSVFHSFAVENQLVLSDPRSTFNKDDYLHGIVVSKQKPRIFLASAQKGNQSFPITNIKKTPVGYVFCHDLNTIKDSNYFLTVQTPNNKSFSQKIIVLPLNIKINKPLCFEKSEPENAKINYYFILAQQYLQLDKIKEALTHFNKMPQKFWNTKSIPIIARAYYKIKDFARVLSLLEQEGVDQNYSNLFMLANATLELRLYSKAIQYLEKIRGYQDTPEINRLLAAAYLSLGRIKMAKKYYNRANQIKKDK